MMRVSTFVISFLLLGFLFLALPQNSHSGFNLGPLGCCVDNNNVCLGCGPSENCAISQAQCDGVLGGNFSQGEICFETMLSSCADPGGDTGCCILARGNCEGGIDIAECTSQNGTGWIIAQSCSELVQCEDLPKSVPSLSQWGLLAVAAALGVVGLFGVLRRRASA